MIDANTPQGTGAMTLDQGVAAMKAKMADKGAKIDDTAIVHQADQDEELDQFGADAPEQVEDAALAEDAEAVSADESQEPEQEPDTRPIILPDGAEITVEEARKGYLRQAEFTRKTQSLAAQLQSNTAQHGAEMQKVSGLYQQLASLQERPPTPDQMMELSRTKTPEEFQQIQAYWQYRTTVMNEAKTQIEHTQAQAMRAAKSQAFEVLSSGEIVPGVAFEPTWKDPKVLSADLQKTADWMVEMGLEPESVNGLNNPLAIWISDLARRQFELQKAKPKAALAVKGKPLPFKPGSKSTASPQAENIRLLSEAFRKTPSVANAVALQKAKAGR